MENYNREYGGEESTIMFTPTHLLAEGLKAAKSSEPEAGREALNTIKYESAVGSVQFDGHKQAKLPVILLELLRARLESAAM